MASACVPLLALLLSSSSLASAARPVRLPLGDVNAVYALLERVLPGASPQFDLSLLPAGAASSALSFSSDTSAERSCGVAAIWRDRRVEEASRRQ